MEIQGFLRNNGHASQRIILFSWGFRGKREKILNIKKKILKLGIKKVNKGIIV